MSTVELEYARKKRAGNSHYSVSMKGTLLLERFVYTSYKIRTSFAHHSGRIVWNMEVAHNNLFKTKGFSSRHL